MRDRKKKEGGDVGREKPHQKRMQMYDTDGSYTIPKKNTVCVKMFMCEMKRASEDANSVIVNYTCRFVR